MQQVENESLSERCDRLLVFFSDKKHHTRAEISIELDLTQSQISNAIEQLRRKGYVFETFVKNKFTHYKLSDERCEPNSYVLSHKQVKDRLIVEMNRIRLLAIKDGYWKVERIARQALEAGGLKTD